MWRHIGAGCRYTMELLVARCGSLVHRRAVKGRARASPRSSACAPLSLVVLSCRPTTLRPSNLEPCRPVLLCFVLYSTRATIPNLRQTCPALRASTERGPRQRLQTAPPSHHTQTCRETAETRPLLLPPNTMALAMTMVKRWARCTTTWRK